MGPFRKDWNVVRTLVPKHKEAEWNKIKQVNVFLELHLLFFSVDVERSDLGKA